MSQDKREVRIGIDVGGTFTHAVAVDNRTSEVISHRVTPTTHKAAEGVAAGIVASFRMLTEELGPETEVVFLAHSTTQATNALLEGDVARVGIVGMGKGMEGSKAKSDLTVGDLELSEGKFLHTQLDFVEPDPTATEKAVVRLKEAGCGAIVAAQGFSVDDPSGEKSVMEQARAAGVPACGTHEMSGLYGLRVRARTAVLNASILPKMIETAEMTHKALHANSETPLMVMRSDGGVMSLEEVRRRPVMTLLSGPAAGVAAALMFLKASDALFLEVGGTSTDICLVKDGKAAIRSASVGGHPTYLKTLDSRTLGIAGGSMVGRLDKGGMTVGPRSAHVAGFHYCAFADPKALEGELKVVEVRPLKGDPVYYAIENAAGEQTAPTTTCAANLLGYIKPGDYSAGNLDSVRKAFEALALHLKAESAEAVARQVMDAAAEKVLPTIRQLLKDYGSTDRTVKLLGGGGGAGSIVPVVAEKLGFPHEIARQAEVISAIGAALAMVKETLERNIVDPSQADLARLRSEAESAVIGMGADPATVEVTVSVDAQKSIVTAVATGSIAFSEGETGTLEEVSPEERLETLKEASPKEATFIPVGDTNHFYLYRSEREERYLFNLLKRKKETLWVTDRKGNVKLQVPGGMTESGRGATLENTLTATLSKHTTYGDAGALIPALHVVAGRKLTDLTSLTTSEQALTLARQELSGLDPDTPVYVLVHPAKG